MVLMEQPATDEQGAKEEAANAADDKAAEKFKHPAHSPSFLTFDILALPSRATTRCDLDICCKKPIANDMPFFLPSSPRCL